MAQNLELNPDKKRIQAPAGGDDLLVKEFGGTRVCDLG